MFLYMKGKCQPKQWRQEEYEVKVNTIELLSDIKDKVIEKLTIMAPLSGINDDFIDVFADLAKANPGNVYLHFHLRDEEGQHVNLMAKGLKISVNKSIISYLNSQTILSYKIN